MKIISFLSRVTFICNISFLLFVLFRWIEKRKIVSQQDDRLIPLPFIKNVIVTLGFTAIIINLIMNAVYIIYILSGKRKKLSFWLMFCNFIFLVLEIFYFFS